MSFWQQIEWFHCYSKEMRYRPSIISGGYSNCTEYFHCVDEIECGDPAHGVIGTLLLLFVINLYKLIGFIVGQLNTTSQFLYKQLVST